jgi:ubiquinone/menaquinone biosynthesis C-methylase UbiE
MGVRAGADSSSRFPERAVTKTGLLLSIRLKFRSELAALEDGQDILEVAGGRALAFHEIVKRNPHGNNLGIDLSTGMLGKAKIPMEELCGAIRPRCRHST